MKKMRFVLLFAMMVCLMGCGGGKPETTVKNAIQCLQKNDLDGAKKYFYYEDTSAGSEEREGEESDESEI